MDEFVEGGLEASGAVPRHGDRVAGRLRRQSAQHSMQGDCWVVGLNAEWETVDGLPIVGVVETPIHGVHSLAKRVEDIVLASVVLTLLWVPMLLIALAIKLTSPGPAMLTVPPGLSELHPERRGSLRTAEALQ